MDIIETDIEIDSFFQQLKYNDKLLTVPLLSAESF